VLADGPTMDDFVSFAVMIGAIYVCSRKYGIVLDWSQTPNPRLVLDGVEYLVDRESQWSEMLFHPEGSK